MRFLRDIYLLIVLSVFIACSDEPVKADLYTMDIEIEAGFNESGARAEVDPANVAKVTWQAGDIIDVYMTDANGVIASGTLTTQSSGAYARFTGPVTASEGLTPPFSIRAVYGATVVAPQANRATFALGQFKPLMEAQCSEPIYYVNRISLSFSQVASAIHINNLPTQVSKVYLESLGENMVGVYSYNLLNGEGVANQNSVEVNAENGSAFIGVAPENYSGGFKLKLFDANGNVQYVKLPPLRVAKGHSYNIAPISEFVPINLALSTAEAYHIDASGSRSTGGTTSDVAQSSISWGEVSFAGAPVSMIQEMGVRVYDSSNNIVYTKSETSFSAKEYDAGAYNWGTYKKHGTKYTVKAFAIVDGETYETAGHNVSYNRPNVVVSTPTGCYTSYTNKYTVGDITGANNCDGSSVYLSGNCTYKGVTAEVFNAMSGSAYLKLDNSTTYGSTVSGQTFSNTVTVGNQSWATHTILSAVQFDGATFESPSSQSVIVTGLPYIAAPPTNIGDHTWVNLGSRSDNVSWSSSSVALISGANSSISYPAIGSPTFNIPTDINTSVGFKVRRNKATFIGSLHGELRVFQLNASNGEGTSIYNSDLKSEASVDNRGSMIATSMTPTYNRWKVAYNYGGVGPVTYVDVFQVYYR